MPGPSDLALALQAYAEGVTEQFLTGALQVLEAASNGPRPPSPIAGVESSILIQLPDGSLVTINDPPTPDVYKCVGKCLELHKALMGSEVKLGIVPVGPGAISGAARNLKEALTLAEAAGKGSRIMMGKIKDPRYANEEIWAKMEYVRTLFDSGTGKVRKVAVHYWQNLVDGTSHGFKFKKR